jgi:hypothetical protein
MQTASDFLQHYGVKGMRWGVRKNGDISVTAAPRKKPPVSDDYAETKELRTKPVTSLSNAQIRKVNERLQLERSYAELTSKQSNMAKGGKFLDKALKGAKTAQTVYGLVNSPAGKAARGLINT